MSLEFEHKGVVYKAGKLNAMRQFHVVRRLAPLLATLTGSGIKPGQAEDTLVALLEPLAELLGSMSDADAEYVLMACLSTAERKQAAGGWAKVVAGDQLMFEDIDMAAMLHIAWQVLQHNLSGFFAGLPQGLTGVHRT